MLRRSCAKHCRIGNRVILQKRCVIGADGLGLPSTKDGSWYKTDSVRPAVTEDDVEIKANPALTRHSGRKRALGAAQRSTTWFLLVTPAGRKPNGPALRQGRPRGLTKVGDGLQLAGDKSGTDGHLTIGNGAVNHRENENPQRRTPRASTPATRP